MLRKTAPFSQPSKAITLDGGIRLRDQLAAVDLRLAERLTGHPIVLTTWAENLELELKRVKAIRYLRGRPEILAARRLSEIALLSHRALPSVSR